MRTALKIIFAILLIFAGVLQGDTLRVVISYSISPDSLVSLRVGGYRGYSAAGISLQRVRVVFSYRLTPDSLVALRVGGFGGYGGAETEGTFPQRIVASFSISPDSLVALRVGGYGFPAVAGFAEKRSVVSFSITPDSLVALRVARFGTDTGASDYDTTRTRWVFSYALAGSVLVAFRSTPPGAVMSIDDTLTYTLDTTNLVWLSCYPHSISTDTLQRTLEGSYWYHFKFWLTSGGDTLWSADTTLYMETSDTLTAYFSYEPTPRVLLKDEVWFDPFGNKRTFVNPLIPVDP